MAISTREQIVLTVYKNFDKNEINYVITKSLYGKPMYYRYDIIDGEMVKTGKSETPIELDDGV